MSWRAYRAWARACLLSAWRATRNHFGGAWRGALKVVGPGVATTLVLCIRAANMEPQPDIPVAIAAGCAASLLWVFAVFCWNFALAPYRLWLAARARIAQLQVAIGRRIERHVIAAELELRIREGLALMDSGSPSQRQLSQWYQQVLRVVARAGDRERALLESSGPAPGTRGGALEMLILSNRIEKLRLILDRQHAGRASRKRLGLPALGARPITGQRPAAVRASNQ
jgi:hypothetical protein